MSSQFANLQEYIAGLPAHVKQNIYGHPASCLAIFRDLPALARTIIMRFICLPNSETTGHPPPIKQGVVESWINPSHESTYKSISKMLVNLGIWNEVGSGWQLDTTFRNNLTGAIFGGPTNWFDESDSSAPSDGSPKSLKELNEYSSTRWDCVLQYLVNPDPGKITGQTIDVFLQAKLLKRVDGATASNASPMITGAGFQFLLMNRRSQVWFFIIHLLETLQQRGEDISEHLIFLFQLSFATFGKDYSSERFSTTKENFVQHLRELGLVWQRTRKVKRFYPTKLAIELASGLAASGSSDQQRTDEIQSGFLVVETNYRVYAYTDNDLYLKIIALFCKMLYRFPNMSVGLITRQSVRRALANEISAELILNFLKSHAHPQMRKRLLDNKSLLPTTISDQIRLWEMESERIVSQDGVLYNQFNTQTDFELIEKYARDLNVLIWSNTQKRCVVVTKAGHEEVKRFWKTQRPKSSNDN